MEESLCAVTTQIENEAVGRSPELEEMNVGGVWHSEPAGGNATM